MPDQQNLEDLLASHSERRVYTSTWNTMAARARGFSLGILNFFTPFSEWNRLDSYREAQFKVDFQVGQVSNELKERSPEWIGYTASENQLSDLQAQAYLTRIEKSYLCLGTSLGVAAGIAGLFALCNVTTPPNAYDETTRKAADYAFRGYLALFCTDGVYHSIKKWVWPDPKTSEANNES